jgi:tetratricopeptide (TPR) repeat protein
MTRTPIACALLLLSLSAPAWADDAAASPEAEGQLSMQRGIVKFGKGNAAEALVEYQRAIELVPNANLPYRYAAEACLALEKYPEAIAYLEKYLSLNAAVSDAAEVRSKVAALRKSKLPGSIELQADHPGASVKIGERTWVLPARVTLPPGSYRATFTKEGLAPLDRSFEVVGDQVQKITVALPRPEAIPAKPERGNTPLWIGGTTLAVGALGLGVSSALDLLSLGPKLDRLERSAKSGAADLAEQRDGAKALSTALIVSYVGSLVLAAAGGVTLLLYKLIEPKSEPSRKESVTAASR